METVEPAQETNFCSLIYILLLAQWRDVAAAPKQQGDARERTACRVSLLCLDFQPSAAPGAQPFHEAAANECGIARGLTFARLVVDLDRQ